MRNSLLSVVGATLLALAPISGSAQTNLATTNDVPAQVMETCRKYFDDKKYRAVVQNRITPTPVIRFYTFKVEGTTPDGTCRVSYGWRNENNTDWRHSIKAVYDGRSMFVGDLRWDWARYTPQSDGTLHFKEHFQWNLRMSAPAQYDTQERILHPTK